MKHALLLTTLLFYFCPLFAQHEVFIKSGEAILGYDPVTYFKEGKPMKGKEEFSYTWKDASWKFTSKQNLELFKANPEKFAPQFGGFCAYGMSEGHKAPTSPDAWTIVNGKLYLNYNIEVRKMWNEKQQDRIEQANKNWPAIKKEKE
jgi:hypothetical protein